MGWKTLSQSKYFQSEEVYQKFFTMLHLAIKEISYLCIFIHLLYCFCKSTKIFREVKTCRTHSCIELFWKPQVFLVLLLSSEGFKSYSICFNRQCLVSTARWILKNIQFLLSYFVILNFSSDLDSRNSIQRKDCYNFGYS